MNTKQSGLGRVIGQTTAIAAAAVLALGFSSARAGVAPQRVTQFAIDIGAATDTSLTVSVMLKNRNLDELKSLIDAQHTPGNAQFHKFLSAKEFHARFDPSADTVAAASAYFAKAGLSVRQEGFMLHVTGPAKSVESAFGVALHQFEVAAHGKSAAVRFHQAMGEPSIKSAAVADSVGAIIGLNSQPHYAPHVRQLPQGIVAKAKASTVAAGHPIQQWTVTDLAAYYNVNPLYAQGFHGEGKTVGIVTLASFTQSDAFEYWNRNGLTTDPNRITEILVQGGSGPISDSGGSGETTLDVEQSGGLAPAAKMVVYEAPNTDLGFVGAFYNAVNDNTADTISVSWGEFEWFETINHLHTKKVNELPLKAFNQIFMQAAAQGQTMIASAGDEGSYEANRAAPVPSFNPVISVGSPADSAYITAAGGTTLPVKLTFSNGFVVTVPTEQAWGWDYLHGFCQSIGFDDIDCGIWGVGGGGGVSSAFAIPNYQKRIAGTAVTEAGQSLTEVDVNPPIDYVDLPAGFAGRNLPDVSLNADPETGYAVDYTDESGVFGIGTGSGGTSFVAPQLNGISALLGQKVGGRIGLLNYPLYKILHQGTGYTGGAAPFNDITAGDTWFYASKPGYDQTTGVGTLNVANFSDVLVTMSAVKK